MLLDYLCPSRKGRRNLASAFAGEIVAAMEAIADNAEIKRLLLNDMSAGAASFDFTGFELPRLAIYEANAHRLSVFNAPLPRELSYFYTRMMTLPGHLRALSLSGQASGDTTPQRTKVAFEEITRTMDLGDSLLRNIRGFISRRKPSSISRA
jgi:hypothetical protein